MEDLQNTKQRFAKAWNIYQKLIGGNNTIENPEDEINRVVLNTDKETVSALYGWYDDTHTMPTRFYECPEHIPQYLKNDALNEIYDIHDEITQLKTREAKLNNYLQQIRQNENEIDWNEI